MQIGELRMGNISKQKRDDLIMKIGNIRSFISASPQDENTGNLLTYLSELEKEVKSKKYGLVFEEHREAVDELLATHVPVMKEDKDLFIENGGQMNFLIEGDNLAALYLLEKTHRGKIDLIYIDPPYNTGQNFIYDDKYIDKEDSFRHSKWISFMIRRLGQAYKLLANKGVIFIQISDIENGNLRLICDSVFGEDNFINEIVVMSKVGAGASGGGEDKRLKKNIEYILVYCKNYGAIDKFETVWKRTELMQYIQSMKNEGKSFKYTSVLTKCQDLTPYKIIKDGSGQDIEIFKVNDYEINP